MKTLKFVVRVALDPLIVACAATAVMINVLFIWAEKVQLGASEWAGWVQAVGSISAILISLGLTNYQIKQQKQGEIDREREESRRICLAIRDELTLLQRLFTEGPNVVEILSLEPGAIFDRKLPPVVPGDRFIIYKAVVGRLTLIDDDLLRQDIIWAYETAIGLIHAGMQNNALLQEIRDFTVNGEMYNYQLCRLKDSAAAMQQICRQTIERVTAILPKLDQAAGRA